MNEPKGKKTTIRHYLTPYKGKSFITFAADALAHQPI